jgi:transposase InsO family protein
VKYQWIKQHANEFSIQLMCRVMEVSRSAFYQWMHEPQRVRQTYRQELAKKIESIRDERYLDTYGSPRMTEELVARGTAVSENTVAKVMKEAGLSAKRSRRFVPTTTHSNHDHPIAMNKLDRDFEATAPNQKWLCDITYIATDEGWLYLAGVLDCFSRKIVGWSMDNQMPAGLVIDALNMAIARRKPLAGLLHHSDRGVQYACDPYQQLLDEHDIQCSMSRVGNCYDNAMKESFWSTLKRELINDQRFKTIAEARLAIFEYIEVFYNRKRRHSSLGYVSPETFEASQN